VVSSASNVVVKTTGGVEGLKGSRLNGKRNEVMLITIGVFQD